MRKRESWWIFAKDLIRQYHENARRLRLMEGRSDPAAVHLQRAVESVEQLLELLSLREDGGARLRLLELLYWRRGIGICRAAMEIPVSERTAKRWNRQLLCIVAVSMGWMEEGENGLD